MKKLLTILLLVGCTKTLISPIPPVQPNVSIFDFKESTVTDGQDIYFNLVKSGTYSLMIMDTVNRGVITRERFAGQVGSNKRKIYTKTLKSKYLYLVLEDSTKTQISKTAIIIN